MSAPAVLETRRHEVTVLGVVLAVAVAALFAVDLLWLSISPIDKRPPAFDAPHLLKIFLSVLASLSFVALVLRRAGSCASDHEAHSTTDWERWGTFRWSSPSGIGFSLTTKELVNLAIAAGAVAFVYIADRAPGLVNRLALEDGPVETLSFLLLLTAVGLFFITAVKLGRSRRSGRVAATGAVLLALVLFLVAMEEISWGQRYLGIETPPSFAINDQGETNLHNFVTWESEVAYYFGAFLLFVVVPFLREHGRFLRHPAVASVAPGRFVMYAGAVSVAFSYTMWNGPFTQLAFFTTLLILLHYGRSSRRAGRTGATPFALATALVVCQAGFLVIGDGFHRSYLLTEYREFLIPVAFLLYGLEVLERAPGAMR